MSQLFWMVESVFPGQKIEGRYQLRYLSVLLQAKTNKSHYAHCLAQVVTNSVALGHPEGQFQEIISKFRQIKDEKYRDVPSGRLLFPSN